MPLWIRSALVQIMACRLLGMIKTNAGLLSIGPFGTNFSEILIKIQNFSLMKIHLKISSAKWRTSCPRGDGLKLIHTGVIHDMTWASYQIRKIAGCACAGNAGNVFPRRRFQRKPLVSDPDMHHGTWVTHVPWCMSGSLTCGDGENVPGIPGACASTNLRIWQEAHGNTSHITSLL